MLPPSSPKIGSPSTPSSPPTFVGTPKAPSAEVIKPVALKPPPVLQIASGVAQNIKTAQATNKGVGSRNSAFNMLVASKTLAHGGSSSKSSAPPPPPPPLVSSSAGGPPPPPPPPSEPFDARATWKRAIGKAKVIGRGSAKQSGEGGRILHGPYWKEKLDHRHRDSRELNQLQRLWKQDPAGGRDFFAWLEKNDAKLPHKTKVEQFTTYAQRRPFHASFGSDGSIRMVDPTHREFVSGHTGEMIFAASHDDQVFVGIKNLGKFHHSTFMGGDAVQSAGTLKLDKGRIVEINDHSGHYTPGVPEMKAMVRLLQKQGVDVSGIIVKTQGTKPMPAPAFLQLKD